MDGLNINIISGFLTLYFLTSESSLSNILSPMMCIFVIQIISIPFTLAYAKRISEQEFRSVLVPKRCGIILLMSLLLAVPFGYNVYVSLPLL